jgi:CO dehydrogenase maturation factor
MEAGIEHLGRGTAMGVDLMLCVVEPGQRSVETAHRVREMAASLGIKQYAVVINKSTAPEEDRAWMGREFGADIVYGLIPFDPSIGEGDRKGVALVDLGEEALLEPFREIYDRLRVAGYE